MFTVVYKAATFQSFTQKIVLIHVLSAYETHMFKLRKKLRGCSVTHQFFLPNFVTFLHFVVTANCYIRERSTGTTVYHSCGPCGGRMMIPRHCNTLSTAAFDAGTLNALSAECTHHICQQVPKPQVHVQVQVLRTSSSAMAERPREA